MLAWIVLVFFLRFKEWILIPALLVYLLVSAVVCNAYVIGMIGNMYYFLREPEKAKKFYAIAVKKNTRNVKALYNYALDALHEGRADEALPIFQRAEKLNVKVLFDKLIPLAVSSCYWVLGDIDKAISTIEDLQKKYNYINPNTLTTLGYFYMLKGNYEKASQHHFFWPFLIVPNSLIGKMNFAITGVPKVEQYQNDPPPAVAIDNRYVNSHYHPVGNYS